MGGGDTQATPVFDRVGDLLDAEEPFALVTIIEGPGTGSKLVVRPSGVADPAFEGTLGDPGLDRVAIRDARGELAAGRSGVRHYGEHGEAREETVVVFVESFAAPPRMLVFGAVDFTGALVRVAKVLGYRVTVCDAREVFATSRRFPMADEVVVDWPHRLLERVGENLGERDVVCVLTHDDKFDVPAVISALDTQVGYIGVMGSRTTHANRLVRLREAGVDEAGLARLRSPLGLDIGARTPEETAVSIVAEIIALRTGRSTRALADSDGVYLTLNRCELDYLAPGRLDDRLEVHTSVLTLGGATLETRQVVRRDGIDLFRGKLRLACVDGEGRPRRLPAAVRSALADLPRQDIPAQQSPSTLAEASR